MLSPVVELLNFAKRELAAEITAIPKILGLLFKSASHPSVSLAVPVTAYMLIGDHQNRPGKWAGYGTSDRPSSCTLLDEMVLRRVLKHLQPQGVSSRTGECSVSSPNRLGARHSATTPALRRFRPRE